MRYLAVGFFSLVSISSQSVAQLTVTINGTISTLVDAECRPASGTTVTAGSSDYATATNGFATQLTVRLNSSSTSPANPTVEVGVPPGSSNFGPLGSLIPAGGHYIWVRCPDGTWVLAGKWQQS